MKPRYDGRMSERRPHGVVEDGRNGRPTKGDAMSAELLLYIGSALIVLWAVAHILPVATVLEGYEPITPANRLIVKMTWVSEGMSLGFLGVLVALVTAVAPAGEPTQRAVVLAATAMLVVSAVWTTLTGSRTRIVPMMICPVVKSVVAALWLLAVLL